MTPRSIHEYIQVMRQRYTSAPRPIKSQLLTEFCTTTGYHRKAAIRVLSQGPRPTPRRSRRGRPSPYTPQLVRILLKIWEAAGYPWSVRLKALLPLWLPWAKQHFAVPPQVERHLHRISPSTIDRHLRQRKRHILRRLYGRTKPGTLLKHHIPVKTEHWDVTVPGFTEVDLVSHSGNSADGEFIQSLNLTDIYSGWVETRAVMGKSQRMVGAAVDDMRASLPFRLHGLDSDNGSEFINYHLYGYCEARDIRFTRGRPYKKDDNAHIEQKNWTHVRRLLGWDRYDSPEALAAMNDLYRHELRLMMNLFQPSVKLQRKTRVGSRLRRVYDRPKPRWTVSSPPRARIAPHGWRFSASVGAWIRSRSPTPSSGNSTTSTSRRTEAPFVARRIRCCTSIFTSDTRARRPAPQSARPGNMINDKTIPYSVTPIYDLTGGQQRAVSESGRTRPGRASPPHARDPLQV